MQASPNYVMVVAENAREAVREAVRAENTACYLDGLNGTREEAGEALARALAYITDLEGLARK